MALLHFDATGDEDDYADPYAAYIDDDDNLAAWRDLARLHPQHGATPQVHRVVADLVAAIR